jgi:class 3 adenylate cyclase/pimeloyl-ACP methyl ester carboxylesterase
MEPRIQYAKTKDGVSIAYWTLGEGPPLVYMPAMPFSNIQLEWQIPEYRTWYERLLQKRTLVRFDSRATGLSGRSPRISLDSLLLDLEAVVDRLHLERFDLFAANHSGPVAITYAARHPRQISHFIVWCSWARAGERWQQPQAEALRGLAAKDWALYSETMARVELGWSEIEDARRLAAYLRQLTTPEAYKAYFDAMGEVDVTGILSQVQSPTLVFHRRNIALIEVDAANVIASGIPDASFVLLEGVSRFPWGEDMEAVADAIDEFLGDGEKAKTGGDGLSADIVHTILFTDVEGSTALTDRLGDAKARELLREHERMVREALKAHSGSEVKALGDGFMTSFSSATKALECAIAVQRAFAAHNESAEEPILVRVGLNAGEPIAEDDDLYGTAVNEAARITATAKGGEILASDVVRQLVKGKDFEFSDRGEVTLKGFDKPVRVHDVKWRD